MTDAAEIDRILSWLNAGTRCRWTWAAVPEVFRCIHGELPQAFVQSVFLRQQAGAPITADELLELGQRDTGQHRPGLL